MCVCAYVCVVGGYIYYDVFNNYSRFILISFMIERMRSAFSLEMGIERRGGVGVGVTVFVVDFVVDFVVVDVDCSGADLNDAVVIVDACLDTFDIARHLA